MIFCDRMVFLHVPKAGGSSITRHLLEVLPRPVYYTAPPDHAVALPADVTRLDGIAHETLAEATIILERHGRRIDDIPLVVACVRNPYELEVSRYAFLRHDLHGYNHGTQQALALLGNFELFARCSRPHGQRPLESYYLRDGAVPPNLRILRLEDLVRELPAALASVRIDGGRGSLGHLNRSPHDDHLRYYGAAAEEAVFEKYKWVFDAGWCSRLAVTGQGTSAPAHAADERFLEAMLPVLAERADAFTRANAWLAAAEVHRHARREGPRHDASERALHEARASGNARLIMRATREVTRCMSLVGGFPVRLAAERCAALVDDAGDARAAGATKLVLAELLAALGRPGTARALCGEMASASPELVLGAASVAASAELLAGDPDAAERRFRLGRPWGEEELWGDRAEALFRLGRRAEADRLTSFTERVAPAGDGPAQARWRRMRAKLMEDEADASVALSQEAVRLAAATAPGTHGDALVDLAEVLTRNGRRHQAAAALVEALAAHERKGNLVAARRTAALLEAARAVAAEPALSVGAP